MRFVDYLQNETVQDLNWTIFTNEILYDWIISVLQPEY